MELAAVDALTKLFLLAFGVVVALAGLWLIFRPPGAGGKTVIQLFGLKFEAASAGILVFVVGIGVVALSLFIPTIPGATSATRVLATGDEPAKGESPQDGLSQAEPRPISLDGTEVEVNDSTGSANHMQVGASVVGEISPEDRVDVFRIDTKDYIGSTLYVTLTGDGSAGLQILQPTGQMIYHEMMSFGGSKTFEGPVEFESYIARVGEGNGGSESKYELLVTAR